MKLVLASQGFTTDEIANEISKLVGKPLEQIHIAIINEAYTAIPGQKSKRWLIKELSNIEKYIGGIIDFVNLRAYSKEEIKERLSQADLIYIVGGKQLVLSKLFKETGTDVLLKELSRKKVIMGTSAGSIVLGTRIKSHAYWEKQYALDVDTFQDKELELVNFNIIPHYMREDRKKWNQSFYEETLKDNPFPVYALTDTQVLIYDNGNIYFVGGNPIVFGKKDDYC